MSDKKYGVYYIIHNSTHKMYVGKGSVSRKGDCSRWPAHPKADSLIGRALRKHGVENFTFGWLETERSEHAAYELEKKFIAYFESYGPLGYNQNWGGPHVFSGCRHSIASRRKMGRLGRKHSVETKAKISASQKGISKPGGMTGHLHSEETKEKMSLAQMGNKAFLGKSHREETRLKVSETMKRYWAERREAQTT